MLRALILSFAVAACGSHTDEQNLRSSETNEAKSEATLTADADLWKDLPESEFAKFEQLPLDRYAGTLAPPVSGFALKDTSKPVSTTLPGITIPIDPVIVTGPIEVGAAADVCPLTGGGLTASGTVFFNTTFSGAIPSTYVGGFNGPLFEHRIYAYGNFNGKAAARIDAKIRATRTSWTATLRTAANATIGGNAHAIQDRIGRRGRRIETGLPVADVTITGSGSFNDFLTLTQTCGDPLPPVVTTQGPSNISASATINSLAFYGVIAPHMDGPILRRIRDRIGNILTNVGDQRIRAEIARRLSPANAAYAEKKSELLKALLAKLPPGCGCKAAGVAEALTPVLIPGPINAKHHQDP